MANAARGLLNRLQQMSGGVVALGVAGGLAYVASEAVYTVEGGHRGIMFSRVTGVADQVVAEGWHLRIPWFEYPAIYDIRTKAHSFASPTGTKDLQMVNISLRVLSRPVATELPSIHRNLGVDYDEKVLPSIVNEVLKSVVARYNANMLITQREAVSRNIREALAERAREFKIHLDDVSITDLTFGQEYAAAVESKQIAQQNAQRAVLVVERAIQEKQQKIVEAEGEATSAALIGKAIAENPGFLNLRKIEAAREIASIMSQSSNRIYLDADNLLLDVTQDIDATNLGPSALTAGPKKK